MDSKQKRTWGEVYHDHQNVRSKNSNNEKTFLTCHEMIALRNKLCW